MLVCPTADRLIWKEIGDTPIQKLPMSFGYTADRHREWPHEYVVHWQEAGHRNWFPLERKAVKDKLTVISGEMYISQFLSKGYRKEYIFLFLKQYAPYNVKGVSFSDKHTEQNYHPALQPPSALWRVLVSFSFQSVALNSLVFSSSR